MKFQNRGLQCFYHHFAWTKKTVIVTGAGRGIGRVLAIGLAESGADVALLARTEKDLQETMYMVSKDLEKTHFYNGKVCVMITIKKTTII